MHNKLTDYRLVQRHKAKLLHSINSVSSTVPYLVLFPSYQWWVEVVIVAVTKYGQVYYVTLNPTFT